MQKITSFTIDHLKLQPGGFFQEGGTAKESFIPLFDYEGL